MPKSRGFNLVELLVVLAVAAVALAAGAPSIAEAIHAAQLRSAASTFVSSLHLVRTQALLRGSPVAMCKSADGQSCSAAGGWEQGWLVFHDPNGNRSPDPGEALIYRGEALAADLVVTGNEPVARVIAFSTLGGPRGAGGGMLAGTVTICRRSPQQGPARTIVLASGGRARVQEGSVGSCG
ncbi:GspH/FimT family protein [Ramlibacter pallidus]|uniref:Type II secretion system protein H n=1 Tax=Ramlibacter pallidus TaxID=2780087 RepID=A0ABR9S8C6_9BURK|nr:GspH/FimT family protein [Ramlibacter pallidus]MBE7369789.1 GspH/FimT family protein [Ramlibacter pallidus]